MNTNNLFGNQNQSMALEMQVHQAFLNSPEGKEAEQVFANSKKLWWEKMNNPQAHQQNQMQQNQNNEEILDLKNQVNQLTNMMTNFLNEINGGNKDE